MDAHHSLSASVTPVVLISACGLVTLALYNRLNAVVARIRSFHQQKIELLENLHTHEPSDSQLLLELIDSQIGKVTVKAKAIQKGLYCLLAAVLAFLLCSLFEAASVWHESLGVVALGIHVLGLCLFFVGVGWAMRELTLSLTPLEEESAYLETLTNRRLAKTLNVQEITTAKAA